MFTDEPISLIRWYCSCQQLDVGFVIYISSTNYALDASPYTPLLNLKPKAVTPGVPNSSLLLQLISLIIPPSTIHLLQWCKVSSRNWAPVYPLNILSYWQWRKINGNENYQAILGCYFRFLRYSFVGRSKWHIYLFDIIRNALNGFPFEPHKAKFGLLKLTKKNRYWLIMIA